jgi:hypothetical protein
VHHVSIIETCAQRPARVEALADHVIGPLIDLEKARADQFLSGPATRGRDRPRRLALSLAHCTADLGLRGHREGSQCGLTLVLVRVTSLDLVPNFIQLRSARPYSPDHSAKLPGCCALPGCVGAPIPDR